MKFNRASFFASFHSLIGTLHQSQVDGIEFLLTAIEGDDRWESVPQVSYFFATVQHETAARYQPIKEFRAKEGSSGRANQDRYWLTGYYGRGYVQITWKKNYEKFGIADEPEKALEPETAYEIATKGMLEGLFTGHKLSEFIKDEKRDYHNARRVINGLDKAREIADHAQNFEAILTAAANDSAELEVKAPEVKAPQVTAQEPVPPAALQAPKPTVTPVSAPGTSIVTKIAAAASAAGPVLAATGLKIGGVEFKTGGLIAFAAVLIVGMVVGAWIWNESQKRRSAELQLSMSNLASPDKENIIAAGSKV